MWLNLHTVSECIHMYQRQIVDDFLFFFWLLSLMKQWTIFMIFYSFVNIINNTLICFPIVFLPILFLHLIEVEFWYNNMPIQFDKITDDTLSLFLYSFSSQFIKFKFKMVSIDSVVRLLSIQRMFFSFFFFSFQWTLNFNTAHKCFCFNFLIHSMRRLNDTQNTFLRKSMINFLFIIYRL